MEERVGYYIVLPQVLTDKVVNSYQVEQKIVQSSDNAEQNVSENNVENTAVEKTNEILEKENTVKDNITSENQIDEISNSATNSYDTLAEMTFAEEGTIEEKIVTKLPGEKVFLTEEEVKNKQITLTVEYDTKTTNEKLLYNKEVQQKIDENIIVTVKGYMPSQTKLQLYNKKTEELTNQVINNYGNHMELKAAYAMKLLNGEQEYKNTDFNEIMEMRIGKLEADGQYLLTELVNSSLNKIDNWEIKNNELVYRTKEFGTYLLIQDLSVSSEQNRLMESKLDISLLDFSNPNIITSTVDVWDGSVSSGFTYGDGSAATPYLITSGADLAYLANQVNKGNYFEGQYFQLTNDIDLDSSIWTPIGSYSNSFRGIFDGAGHKISNGIVQTDTSLPTNTVKSYGIFGSIGGGNSSCEIKNIEFNNIQVSILASGTTTYSTSGTKGYNIGIVTGTMYRNSSVVNVIIKNGKITDTGTITLRNNSFQVLVGGIAGDAIYSSSSTSDPGEGARYKIENCYVAADIDLSITLRNSTMSYAGQYYTGGIIGRIRSQPIWPSNCLFSGSITARGFIGPIFGAVRQNTSHTSTSNFATLWNGNDAGNLTMESFYTNYSANGTRFTSTVTSGTSTSRISNSTNNIGSVQGVNKGQYTTNMTNMLTMFNNYAGNSYTSWKYENGEFSFLPRLLAAISEPANYSYFAEVDDAYLAGEYQYTWYIDGEVDSTIQGNSLLVEPSLEYEYYVEVVISDGTYYTVTKFKIPKLSIEISFDIDTNNNSVTAHLEGTALSMVTMEDYTFAWYKEDISGLNSELIEDVTGLTLTGLEQGMDYKLVATNERIPQLSTENSFTYGNRIVIFCDYANGNNYNDGYTPETAVKNLSTAYGKLNSSWSRTENVIVLMGEYEDTSYLNSETDTTYQKNVTITGTYKRIDYNASLHFEGANNYRYMTADTTFQYLDFIGSTSSGWWGTTPGSVYFYLQGHSLTIGEDVSMLEYTTANTNQGLLGSRAPAFHIIAGWLQYNYATLPSNNPEILIKSGSYGRIILGGSPGTNSVNNLVQNTSHNFTGSSRDDMFNISVTIDIQNSTTPSDYDYDVNLLVGGPACGNTYANVVENIKSGKVGRVLGGSIGDTSNRPSNWNYPINTFLGTTVINISGGEIAELYGGCLGRNMSALSSGSGLTCDSYFYGDITINVTGGVIQRNIYGAGAGGVTGYHENSSDTYKSYGQSWDTSVNINVSGGTINGNIYGGGYGYTEYLVESVIATDGGALYGNSNINISGNPTINGNIYAAGCGYNLSSKPKLAQMTGTTNIEIEGTPVINGSVYGAGMGISGMTEMAKLTGVSNVKINTDLGINIYGGGNISQTSGKTNIYILSGNQTANIYGGGNLGQVDGSSNVYIQGGNSNNVFGGGESSDVTNTYLSMENGAGTNLYGGSNKTGRVETSQINAIGGVVANIYGGNNDGGNCANTTINLEGTEVTDTVYGGGNKADIANSNVYMRNGKVNNIFGGGNAANSSITNVILESGTVSQVYGGANLSGQVDKSNIVLLSGSATSVYGGNNAGGTNIESLVQVQGGSFTNIFGGGNKAITTTSNVEVISGNITNLYGGGNEAGVTTSNVTLKGGNIDSTFGGANVSGEVQTANIQTLVEQVDDLVHNSQLLVNNLYGGNNAGGLTVSPNVTIQGGNIKNIYGGGNKAEVPTTNVLIEKGTIGNVYGGGNEATVQTDTKLVINGGNITTNVYGGGNEGTVTQNTNVKIVNASIGGSVYAGGNGTTAIVFGNTKIQIEGNTVVGTTESLSPRSGCVFGGGNAAATGTELTNQSTSSVEIVGGTIYGNVYGGANTSVVYGYTNVKIGYEAVGDETLTQSDIYIKGTIFGGGEANASGSEVYDYSFISVTKGIQINIDATGYDSFKTEGSIFGSGNASSTSGESYINIKNYGTIDSPQKNISIQRATTVTLDNSAIVLSGATDRTNEYSTTFFSFSRIDVLKMKNNTTLYLNCGANLLKNVYSLLEQNGVEEKQTVVINEETGETTRNVDNRIYMYEGKNLNIATNEQVTTYGEVYGMAFLGLYTNTMNPSTSTGLYHHSFNNGDKITNAGTFSSNSYVLARHKEAHDIKVDGFYTNYDEEGYIKSNYIGVTPEDDLYYIWMVGEEMDVTTFEIGLTASKYATLGTYELPLTGFSAPNIRFSINGFSAGLENGISLVDETEIPPIADTVEIADSVFGLSMKSGKQGWSTTGRTDFYTAQGGSYSGKSDYRSDNSNYTPTLTFCFYHSQNLTKKQILGTVKIRFQVLTPVDDLNYSVSYMDINITLSTALYQDDYYEAAITPGEEFNLFTTTETNITDSSIFSTYYSLFIPDFSESDYYEDFATYHRVLVSRDKNNLPYVFPANTKITMLDLATNKNYYYVVTAQDEQEQKFIYQLSKFILEGTTNVYYDEPTQCMTYYNQEQNLVYENFIFHINFRENIIVEDAVSNSLLMELQDENSQTLIGVLGIQRDLAKYGVYINKDAIIHVNAEILPNDTVYLGDKFNLNVTTDFEQKVIQSKVIYDTQYFDQKMGIKISIFDHNENQLNSDSLLGITFTLDGVTYYPRIDGTVRINIADRLSNVLSRIVVDTSNNSVLATGDYKIKIESFGSADGIYYGLESSDFIEKNVTIINGLYGLKVKINDKIKIIDKVTGKTLYNNNSLIAEVEYSSSLSNPRIAMTLQRRLYDNVYSREYETVDLADYVTDTLSKTSIEKEYVFSTSPVATSTTFLTLKENLKSGTYRLVFKLYDKDNYIGEVYEYLIIK